MQAGIAALLGIAGREPARAATFDLGFALGPRLNAAGRLADMSLGIECLVTDDPGRALNIAQQLDAINRERRVIEAGMREDAELLLASLDPGNRASLTLFDPAWHQGVIGILAGRVKEKLHRPTFAFARGNAGELKASGRSIPGLHLRDALDLVAKRHPGMLLRFGGHAAAAGLTLKEDRLAEFEAAFEKVCRELLSPADLSRTLETDGPLESGYFSLDAVRLMQQEVWGQGFPGAGLRRQLRGAQPAHPERQAPQAQAAKGRPALRCDPVQLRRRVWPATRHPIASAPPSASISTSGTERRRCS